MSIYKNLLNRPPKIVIKENAREVHINTRSCMCDNTGRLTFRKNADGDFRVNGGQSALSNWQMEDDFQISMEWAADDGNWQEVIRIINTGTSVAESARSR